MARLTLAEIKALAAQNKETAVDMTQEVKGGGGSRKLPEGMSLGRFVEYIEYGEHPQEFDGKPKAPALEFRLGFELYDEGYCNPDGSPYIIRTFDMPESRNIRAKAFKAFAKMNLKKTATTFPELLGEMFLIPIKDYTNKAKKTSSIIDLDGIMAPIDPRSKKAYPDPDNAAGWEDRLSLFLWSYPIMEVWDSLKIDGTNDEGKSKNYIQEKMLSATNFVGSELESMLMEAGVEYKVPVASQKAQDSDAAMPDDEPEAPVEAAMPDMPDPE